MKRKTNTFKLSAVASSGLLMLCPLLLVQGCEKSPLGPDIEGSTTPLTETEPTVAEVAQPESTPASPAATPVPSTPSDPEVASCERTAGHDVYYVNSTVTLTYTCDKTVSSVDPVNKPSYLTASTSGSTVTFTGIPTSAAAAASWSFTVNGLSTTDDAASISTTVLTYAALAANVNASIDLAGNNNVAFSIENRASLDSSWNGDMADVSLAITAIDTDLVGLTLQGSCASATPPYVCVGTPSVPSTNVRDGGHQIRWAYSPFDQGTYYFDVTSQLTIEGASHDMAEVSRTITIPIQSTGNVTLDTDGINTHNSSIYNDVDYTYGLTIGSDSTPAMPVMGLGFIGLNGVAHNYSFSRITVDRSATTATVTQPTSSDTFTTANSKVLALRGASSGKWIAAAETATTGTDDLQFFSVSSSSSDPAVTAGALLTTFSTTTHRATWVSMSEPFTDSDNEERVGIAFVRRESSISYLTVAKARTSPSDLADWQTITDDVNYRADKHDGSYAGDFVISSGAASNDFDRTKIQWTSEGGTGQFYVAYRNETDIKITKLLSTNDSGYGATTATLSSGVLSEAGQTNAQTLDLAIGKLSGDTVAAVVYRKPSTGRCYFRRMNQDLSQASTEVELTTNTCYYPQLAFNANSGRFIVTFADRDQTRDNDTRYDIVTSEVTLASNGADTASTPVSVLETGSTTQPIKLAATYYPAGDWIGFIYRIQGQTAIKLHGYHVSDR